jgi:NADP-dependent 3-hydroxy acid dehydrogenase YdfG
LLLRAECSSGPTPAPEHLKDQTALVTGASQGIGKAIVLQLAAAGAGVCLVGREEQKLEAAAEEARAAGSPVFIHRADLTVDGDLQRLCSFVTHDVRRLEILVHCAGIYSRGSVDQAPLEAFDALFRANVRAPYALTQALLPLLRASHGQVVFVNSTVGLQAPAGVGQFAATQHALKAIADSLRQEVNADGIRVLSVYPGRTATPRQAIIFQMEGRRYEPHLLMQPEDVARTVVHALCLPRTAEVTDISIRPLRKPGDAR